MKHREQGISICVFAFTRPNSEDCVWAFLFFLVYFIIIALHYVLKYEAVELLIGSLRHHRENWIGYFLFLSAKQGINVLVYI